MELLYQLSYNGTSYKITVVGKFIQYSPALLYPDSFIEASTALNSETFMFPAGSFAG